MQYEYHPLVGISNYTMANLLLSEDTQLKICNPCKKAFIAQNKRDEFCSGRCRNQFNVCNYELSLRRIVTAKYEYANEIIDCSFRLCNSKP